MHGGATLLSNYFDDEVDPAQLPPYFTLGARQPVVGTAAMDSSDQSVVTFDEVTGVAAYRSGVNLVGPDQEVTWRSIGEILYVAAYPAAPTEPQLRAKLSLEQSLRLSTGRRPFYMSLRSGPPMIPPRLVAAGLRVVEDYRRLQAFANSVYAVPGMLFMADGRLNAQNFPGAAAVDLQARLLRARGVRYIALTKDGMLVSAARREARTIRARVGDAPFAFPILKRHLLRAYPGSEQSTAIPKTIRHGSSSAAFGGVGAIRFALSLIADHLTIVEMSLYDFGAYAGLVKTGERLENYLCRRKGIDLNGRRSYPAFYSWDILEFVDVADWDNYIVPTLEEVVFTAYTDTELGIYPRALSDIHNRIKLRFGDPELEMQRMQIIVELARAQVFPLKVFQSLLMGPTRQTRKNTTLPPCSQLLWRLSMAIPKSASKLPPLDVIAAVNGQDVTVELDVRNNDRVRVGDRYVVKWRDGAITVLRVDSFKSAEEYSNTIARRIEAMREGIAGPPETPTARKAYQTKLAVMRIEGEVLRDGTRRLGGCRVPDVMIAVQPMEDDQLERFVTSKDGNLLLGNLRAGRRVLARIARIRHNYGGDRMVILGRPGMGKSQLVRALLSQAMNDE
jgi:hypothetical protein